MNSIRPSVNILNIKARVNVSVAFRDKHAKETEGCAVGLAQAAKQEGKATLLFHTLLADRR